MEEAINAKITEYLTNKNLPIKLKTDYKKGIVKTKDIIIDGELLQLLLLSNLKFEKKEEYEDYYNLVTPSFRLYMRENIDSNKELELNFTYLLNIYQKDISSIYKFISLLHDVKKLNIKEPQFYKYNSDEIKIFSTFLIYFIKNEKIDFNNFVYAKNMNYKELIDMKQKKAFPQSDSKIIKLIENFDEILDIFEEIYDTKILNELSEEIISFDKIRNNKLFITNKNDKVMIQMLVKKEHSKEICSLIKKIKETFKEFEIILFTDDFKEDFYLIFKNEYITNLLVRNSESKNLFMLKNNKDLFIYMDLEEKDKSKALLNQFFGDIKKTLPNTFETLFLMFNKNNKIHKVKITLDLSQFGYFIKDKAMQNYFSLNEYNEEQKYYSIYLYSKNNTFCYELFKLENPIVGDILPTWLEYGSKKVANSLDSLILINGYKLMLKSTEMPQKEYYSKIIFQINQAESQYEKEFNEALKKINIMFHTKNIYYVKSLADFIDENKAIPTTTFTSYNKRGYDTLFPFFNYIYRKQPILNKKPIILQVSYFLSYKLNVYGLNNELDK